MHDTTCACGSVVLYTCTYAMKDMVISMVRMYVCTYIRTYTCVWQRCTVYLCYGGHGHRHGMY